MNNYGTYFAFFVGLAVGLEFGFRWGQAYMFNQVVASLKRVTERHLGEKDDGEQRPKS